MKIKRLLITLCAAAIGAGAAVALVGCNGEEVDPHEGQVKVVFSLEGASFKNMTEPVVYYYDFEDGTENLIKDPTSLTGEELAMANYNFKGWYRTKTVDGNKTTYSDKWDFETDKVGDDGVTLYACWRQYSYDAGYMKNGNFVSLKSPMYVYDDNEKTYKFDSNAFFRKYKTWTDDDKQTYTATRLLYDESGNPWDPDFEHPRGDADLSVRVVVGYVKGSYKLVGTAAELEAAGNSDNIYLTNDIDFKGAEMKSFSGYTGTFDGNGHTLKNFSVKYSSANSDLVTDDDLDGRNLLCISPFGRTNGATVKNVNFENVTVDVKTSNSRISNIYVAPLFVKANNSTFENIKYTGTVKVSELPSDFAPDKLHVVTDAAVYLGEKNTSNNVVFDIKYDTGV